MTTDFSTVELLAYIVGLIGGLNWLLIEAFEVDVVQELGAATSLVYILIGVSAFVALLDALDVIELSEVAA